jgi:hypothetical protein
MFQDVSGCLRRFQGRRLMAMVAVRGRAGREAPARGDTVVLTENDSNASNDSKITV